MSDHGWTTAASIFRVQSLRASTQHYIGVPGFQLEWEAGRRRWVRGLDGSWTEARP
jgi:hypothetical protein